MQSFDFNSALVGQCIAFDYPAANYRGVRTRWEPRRLRVEAIHDPSTQPIDPATIEADPLLCRDGVLVIGWDLDKQDRRRFYSGRMRAPRLIREPEVFTLAQVIEEGAEVVLQPAMEPPRAAQYVDGFNRLADVTGRRCRAHAFTLASFASDELR